METGRPYKHKKTCEQGAVFVKFRIVSKMHVWGDGGEHEHVLDDVFGIWVTTMLQNAN